MPGTNLDAQIEDDGDTAIDRQTRSRATTNRNNDPEKVWTTEEILADEDLWRVTDSSEDEDSQEETKGDKQRETALKAQASGEFGKAAAQTSAKLNLKQQTSVSESP